MSTESGSGDDYPNPSAAFLAQYERDIQRMSADFSIPESRVREALAATPGRTASCLLPDELEDLAALAAERAEHINSCHFCHTVKLVMDSMATQKEIDEFESLVHPAEDSLVPTCATCGQVTGSTLEQLLSRMGIMHNVKESGTLGFVKENPGKVAAGVAAIAVGAGLLYSALREDMDA
jgi:hypothetical protein